MTTTDEALVEAMARSIMTNRDNGGCLVVDWEIEAKDNPHVAQALNQARSLLPLIETDRARVEKETMERCAGVADEFEHHENGRAYDKRREGRDDSFNCARAAAAAHIIAAIRALPPKYGEK